MEDLPLGRIAALVPEFAVKDLPLGRILMMMMMMIAIEAGSKFKERKAKDLMVNLLVPLGIHRQLWILSPELLKSVMLQKKETGFIANNANLV